MELANMLGMLYKLISYLTIFLFLLIVFFFTKEHIFNLLTKYDIYKPSYQDNTSMKVDILGGDVNPVKIYKEKLTKKVESILIKIQEKQKSDEGNFTNNLQDLIYREFNDSYKNVNMFADWFFAYTTQYKILHQGAVGIMDKYRAGLNGFSLTEAASENINDYISNHYRDIVLKPNLLEPSLSLHLEELCFAFIKQKDDFMKNIDSDFEEFLYLTSKELSSLNLKQNIDWENNIKNTKSLLNLKNKKGEGGVFTIATISILSKAIGAKVTTSITSKAVAGKIIAKTSLNKMIASLSTKLASGVSGAGIGLIVGGVIDYSMNKGDELANRKNFVKDVNQSLDNIREIIYNEIIQKELIKELYSRDVNTYKNFINNTNFN